MKGTEPLVILPNGEGLTELFAAELFGTDFAPAHLVSGVVCHRGPIRDECTSASARSLPRMHTTLGIGNESLTATVTGPLAKPQRLLCPYERGKTYGSPSGTPVRRCSYFECQEADFRMRGRAARVPHNLNSAPHGLDQNYQESAVAGMDQENEWLSGLT